MSKQPHPRSISLSNVKVCAGDTPQGSVLFCHIKYNLREGISCMLITFTCNTEVDKYFMYEMVYSKYHARQKNMRTSKHLKFSRKHSHQYKHVHFS